VEPKVSGIVSNSGAAGGGKALRIA